MHSKSPLGALGAEVGANEVLLEAGGSDEPISDPSSTRSPPLPRAPTAVRTIDKFYKFRSTSCEADWNPKARENTFLGLSSMSFGLYGVFLCALRYQSGWLPLGVWLMWQAVASYMADVWNCGKMSLWHGLDKYSAVITVLWHTSFFVWTFMWLVRERDSTLLQNVVLSMVSFVSAVYCYANSVKNVRSKRVEGYMKWHAMWHYFGSFGGILLTLKFEDNTGFQPLPSWT